MDRKKLRQNYDVVDYETEKGKVKSKVIYRGAVYGFTEVKDKRTFAALLAVLTAICAVTFLLPLCFDSEIMRVIYVAMPQVLQGFSVLFLALSSVKAFTAKYPYREEVFSELFVRPAIFGIVGAALAFITLVGGAIYSAAFTFGVYEILVLSCSAIGIISYILLFLTARRFRRIAVKTETAQENGEDRSNGVAETDKNVDG